MMGVRRVEAGDAVLRTSLSSCSAVIWGNDERKFLEERDA